MGPPSAKFDPEMEQEDAVALIEAKATPQELDDYKRFILNLADEVASAHREGEATVSDAERAAIAEIAEALGAAPAQA